MSENERSEAGITNVEEDNELIRHFVREVCLASDLQESESHTRVAEFMQIMNEDREALGDDSEAEAEDHIL